MERKPQIERTCLECGKSFLVCSNVFRRPKNRSLFCRRSCWNSYRRKQAQANPDCQDKKLMVRAHGLVNMRLRRGAVSRPGGCSTCGKQGQLKGHHPDYSRPGEVLWLCHSCHMKLHWPKVAI